tara:strand:- start:705 stop:911 length:207 start_codon:yes stop_codon:yes gene_type:complete
VCELLKTVSLLKSELIKEIMRPKKLIKTKKNCKKENWRILLSISSVFLKFLIEKKAIISDVKAPNDKE